MKKGTLIRGTVITVCGFALLMLQGNLAQADTATTDPQTTAALVSKAAPATNTNTQPTNQTTQQPQQNENHGWLDNVSYANGQLTASGWHVADASASEPYHYVIVWDQTTRQQLASHQVPTTTRYDVQTVYPQVANSGQSGWRATFNIASNAWLNDNLQLVSRYSDSATGNGGSGRFTDFWSNTVTSDKRNLANLDSATIQNHQLVVSGWHATDGAYDRPNHFLILLANGREIARHQVTNTTRNDVGGGVRQRL